MNNAEFDRDIVLFANENISFELDKASPDEPINFYNGIQFFYTNDYRKRIYSISRKYSTKEILPEQLWQMVRPSILTIKQNPSQQEQILENLHRIIKESVKDRIILLPVTGIEVMEPFQIGIFTLWSRDDYVSKNSLDLDRDIDHIESTFPTTIAVAKLHCHPKSAKEIGINKLRVELTRLKAFIFYLGDSSKYWIQPLRTDTTLSDCHFVYGDQECTSGLSHVANLMPLLIDAKKKKTSKSFREFLLERMNFQSIIDGHSEFWKTLKIGYEWLGKQYDEERLENKLIYSIFALECLLANANNFSSISAAIAEKCAYLIGKNQKERMDVFKLAKELYNLRSALVHGNSSNSITEEKVWQAYDLAMAVYREITQMTVDGKISSQEELDHYIMDIKFE